MATQYRDYTITPEMHEQIFQHYIQLMQENAGQIVEVRPNYYQFQWSTSPRKDVMNREMPIMEETVKRLLDEGIIFKMDHLWVYALTVKGSKYKVQK